MNTNTFEDLKEKYKQGYRCIRTENENGTMKIYLKNFETEKTETMVTNNHEEISQINQYIHTVTEG
ncbi:hypothetical protein [Defluviitalea saccharophila]|uniref:Uncharacterized protein n=1 Tax=Defluviitalea saccharophila TaxID=879970 RepID=A0ABZ2Y8I9_9FIRM|nr:hypothetical protein [Candidatus Epulonipiscium sp.]